MRAVAAGPRSRDRGESAACLLLNVPSGRSARSGGLLHSPFDNSPPLPLSPLYHLHNSFLSVTISGALLNATSWRTHPTIGIRGPGGHRRFALWRIWEVLIPTVRPWRGGVAEGKAQCGGPRNLHASHIRPEDAVFPERLDVTAERGPPGRGICCMRLPLPLIE